MTSLYTLKHLTNIWRDLKLCLPGLRSWTVCQTALDGTEKVIAYASRALRKAERNYPAHKLEFLCLKWAGTEKFHDYLYGNTFTVRTDNKNVNVTVTKMDVFLVAP
jgi:hypothetical protein